MWLAAKAMWSSGFPTWECNIAFNAVHGSVAMTSIESCTVLPALRAALCARLYPNKRAKSNLLL